MPPRSLGGTSGFLGVLRLQLNRSNDAGGCCLRVARGRCAGVISWL